MSHQSHGQIVLEKISQTQRRPKAVRVPEIHIDVSLIPNAVAEHPQQQIGVEKTGVKLPNQSHVESSSWADFSDPET